MYALILLFGCDTPDDLALKDTESTEDPSTWPCGPYAPQAAATLPWGAVSLRYTHDYDDPDDGVGTLVFEALGTREVNGEAVWDYNQHGEADNGTSSIVWDMLNSYQCLDGSLLQVTIDYSGFTTTGGDTVEEFYVREYTQRPVIYKAGMQVGDEWDYDARYDETSADGTVKEGMLQMHRVVADEVEVEVPAGTFTALYIETTAPDGTNPQPLYLAEGVGAVKGTSSELRSWEDFR